MTGSREGRRPACERGGSACWTKAALRLRTYASKTQFASFFGAPRQNTTILMTVTFLRRSRARLKSPARCDLLRQAPAPGRREKREITDLCTGFEGHSAIEQCTES